MSLGTTYWGGRALAGPAEAGISLEGDLSVSFTTSGDLTVQKNLAGNITLDFTVPDAELTTARKLAGDVILDVTTTGDLTVQTVLFGNVTTEFTTTGDLSIQKILAADAFVDFSTTGDLSIQKVLAGDSAISFTVAGDLTVQKPLEGTVSMDWQTELFLRTSLSMLGDVSMEWTIPATELTVQKPLAGDLSLDFTLADTALNVIDYPDVRNQLEIQYGIRVTNDLVINLSGVIAKPLVILFSERINRSLQIRYTLMQQIRSALNIEYNLDQLAEVRKAFDLLWDGNNITQDLDISYTLRTQVRNALEMPWRLTTNVNNPFVLSYDLYEFDKVRAAMELRWSLLTATNVQVTDLTTITLIKNGTERVIDYLSLDMQIDEGSYQWTGSFELADVTKYSLFQFDDEVVVVIASEQYNMVVDSKSLDRTKPQTVVARINLVSIAARFAIPRSQPVTQTFDTPVMASQAAEQVLGTAIDWQLIDWLLPAGVFAVEEADPVEAIQKLIGAAGGYLETNPDGTFLARRAYPVKLSNWPLVSPDHIYTDASDNLTSSVNPGYVPIVDKLRIRSGDEATFGDRIEFTPDDDTRLAGTLDVYPAPYRDVTVQHTGPLNISLTRIGPVEPEFEEVIEITEGSGQLQHPVYQVLSIQWLVVDLGSLTFEPDSTTVNSTSTTKEYSLVRVKYRSRAIRYRTSSPVQQQVQYLVVDAA